MKQSLSFLWCNIFVIISFFVLVSTYPVLAVNPPASSIIESVEYTLFDPSGNQIGVINDSTPVFKGTDYNLYLLNENGTTFTKVELYDPTKRSTMQTRLHLKEDVLNGLDTKNGGIKEIYIKKHVKTNLLKNADMINILAGLNTCVTWRNNPTANLDGGQNQYLPNYIARRGLEGPISPFWIEIPYRQYLSYSGIVAGIAASSDHSPYVSAPFTVQFQKYPHCLAEQFVAGVPAAYSVEIVYNDGTKQWYDETEIGNLKIVDKPVVAYCQIHFFKAPSNSSDFSSYTPLENIDNSAQNAIDDQTDVTIVVSDIDPGVNAIRVSVDNLERYQSTTSTIRYDRTIAGVAYKQTNIAPIGFIAAGTHTVKISDNSKGEVCTTTVNVNAVGAGITTYPTPTPTPPFPDLGPLDSTKSGFMFEQPITIALCDTIDQTLDCGGEETCYNKCMECVQTDAPPKRPSLDGITNEIVRKSILDKYEQDFNDWQTENTGNIWTAVGCFPTNPSRIISYVFTVLSGIMGGFLLICIIWNGFQVMTSAGNPEALKKAQESITSCVIGFIVLLFAILIIRIIGVDILQLPWFGPAV